MTVEQQNNDSSIHIAPTNEQNGRNHTAGGKDSPYAAYSSNTREKKDIIILRLDKELTSI